LYLAGVLRGPHHAVLDLTLGRDLELLIELPRVPGQLAVERDDRPAVVHDCNLLAMLEARWFPLVRSTVWRHQLLLHRSSNVPCRVYPSGLENLPDLAEVNRSKRRFASEGVNFRRTSLDPFNRLGLP